MDNEPKIIKSIEKKQVGNFLKPDIEKDPSLKQESKEKTPEEIAEEEDALIKKFYKKIREAFGNKGQD